MGAVEDRDTDGNAPLAPLGLSFLRPVCDVFEDVSVEEVSSVSR